MSFYLKAGDLEPPMICSLQEDGTALDLTGVSSILLRARNAQTGDTWERALAVPGDIVGPETDGKVQIVWQAGETDAPGNWRCEFVIEWTAAPDRPQTFPNSGYHEWFVEPNLAG